MAVSRCQKESHTDRTGGDSLTFKVNMYILRGDHVHSHDILVLVQGEFLDPGRPVLVIARTRITPPAILFSLKTL